MPFPAMSSLLVYYIENYTKFKHKTKILRKTIFFRTTERRYCWICAKNAFRNLLLNYNRKVKLIDSIFTKLVVTRQKI